MAARRSPWGGISPLVPVELVCVCQDDSVVFLHRATQRKWHKYQGLPSPHGSDADTDLPPSLRGRDLLQELRTAGWCVLGQHPDGRIDFEGPYIITVAIGATGQTLYCSRTALMCLGLSAAAADATLHSLARYAIRDGARILRTKLLLQRRLFPSNSALSAAALAAPSSLPAPHSRSCRPSFCHAADRLFRQRRSTAAIPLPRFRFRAAVSSAPPRLLAASSPPVSVPRVPPQAPTAPLLSPPPKRRRRKPPDS